MRHQLCLFSCSRSTLIKYPASFVSFDRSYEPRKSRVGSSRTGWLMQVRVLPRPTAQKHEAARTRRRVTRQCSRTRRSRIARGSMLANVTLFHLNSGDRRTTILKNPRCSRRPWWCRRWWCGGPGCLPCSPWRWGRRCGVHGRGLPEGVVVQTEPGRGRGAQLRAPGERRGGYHGSWTIAAIDPKQERADDHPEATTEPKQSRVRYVTRSEDHEEPKSDYAKRHECRVAKPAHQEHLTSRPQQHWQPDSGLEDPLLKRAIPPRRALVLPPAVKAEARAVPRLRMNPVASAATPPTATTAATLHPTSHRRGFVLGNGSPDLLFPAASFPVPSRAVGDAPRNETAGQDHQNGNGQLKPHEHSSLGF